MSDQTVVIKWIDGQPYVPLISFVLAASEARVSGQERQEHAKYAAQEAQRMNTQKVQVPIGLTSGQLGLTGGQLGSAHSAEGSCLRNQQNDRDQDYAGQCAQENAQRPLR